MFKIMGKYKGGSWEEIDTADTKQDAEYLLQEYRIAYGGEWRLKITKEK